VEIMTSDATTASGLLGSVFMLDSGTGFGEWSQAVTPGEADGRFAASRLSYDGSTLGEALGLDGLTLSDPSLADAPLGSVGLALSGYVLLEAGTYTFYNFGRSGGEGLGISLGGQALLGDESRSRLTIPEDALVPIEALSIGGGSLWILAQQESGRSFLSLQDRLYPDAEAYFGFTPAEESVLEGLLYFALATAEPAPAEPVNAAPVAAADSASTAAGTSVLIDALSNDTDQDGDALTIGGVSDPANGSATIENGQVRYTPDAGFSGTERFSYTVADGQGGSDTAEIAVTVAPPPADEHDMTLVPGGTETGSYGNRFNGTSDPDGRVTAGVTLTAGEAAAPMRLSFRAYDIDMRNELAVEVNGTRVATFGGGTNNGFDALEVGIAAELLRAGENEIAFVQGVNPGYVCDGRGGSDTAEIAVTVAPPPNAAPEALADGAATGAGTPVLIDALANDADPDGDALTLTGVSNPANGSAAIENGQIRYTPDTGFSGTETFTYAVEDGRGGSDTATVTVEVAPAAEDPVSDPGAAAGLAAEYHRLSGEIFSLSDIDFSRAPDATGTVDRLDYPVSTRPFWDGGPTNVFAARYAGELNVAEGGSYTFHLTSDDGSALYIDGREVILHDGLHPATERSVTLDLAAGAHAIEVRYFEYYADQSLVLEWTGPDSGGQRAVISGEAFSHGGEAPAPEPNAAPEALADDAATGAGSSVLIDALANDSDPDGDALTLAGVSDPANGTAAIEGGRIRYTPDAGFSGTETFTYAVEDGQGGSDTATVSVEVTAATGNGLRAEYFALPTAVSSLSGIDFSRAPDATGTVASLARTASDTPFWNGGPTDNFAARYTGALNVAEAGRYTFHLTSDDGSALSIDGQRVIDNDGLHGDRERSVTLDLAAGAHAIEIVYFERGGLQTLELDWAGPDTGGQRAAVSGAALSHGGEAPAPAPEPNAAPEALPDDAVTEAGTSVLIDALANDSDPDGDALTLAGVSDPANGTAAIENGQVRYTADAGFSGTETFTYAVEDGNGGSDTATVSVEVTAAAEQPVNTAPDALADEAFSDAGAAVLIDVLANDSDPDGDMLTLTGVSDPANGTAATENGQVRYTPDAGFSGTETFTYAVFDGNGGSDSAGVTVTVQGATDGGMDHGDHGSGGEGLPGTAEEIEAFVAAELARTDSHSHADGSGMAMEHMDVMNLVPRAESTHVAIANGDWSDPSTWYQGRIPGEGARVLIPEAASVTYDAASNASLFTVRVDGELAFSTTTDTRMVLDTMVVSPTGRLEIGTEANPVAAGVSAEILIADNGNIDTSWDPKLFSRGVISHGEAEIHGAGKTSFLKVASAPMAGDTTISLAEAPEGWQVGDTIVLTGTHKTGWTWTGSRVEHLESQDEEVTITAISGNTVTIDRPLEHDHDTPRDDLAAYVANMSRNVTIRSEGGEDLPVHQRGHTMFMHSQDVDVRYAAFDDLGRTDKSAPATDVNALSDVSFDSNIKARYPFHFHRTGTEDQENPALAIGNAVSGSPGWGFVHHSSHADFVENVSFDVFGAHFAAEDGDETGAWLRNLAIRAEGIGYGESVTKQSSDLPRHDNGRTGDGFFFAGRLVESAENVAANTTNGYVWMHRSAPSNPLSANLDQPEAAYGAETIRLDHAPIHGFRDNEAFGTQSGVIVVKANHRQEHDVRTVLDGFLNWETSQGMDITYTSHYTIKNVDLIGTRNDAPVASPDFGFRVGGNTYDLVVNGIEIENFPTGVTTLNRHTFPVTDDEARTHVIDARMTDVGNAYTNFPAGRLAVLDSSDLAPGRLSFDMQGDTTISHGETLFFDGVKTDSLGSRWRQSDSMDDIQRADFWRHIEPMLREDGYYETSDGRYVMIVEDFVADRATGELLKIGHVVTLAMSEARLAGLGAVNNGPIDPGGPAPSALDDTAFTSAGEAVFVDVLANDSDPDGGALRVDGIDHPDHGEVHEQEDGTLLYVPDPGFSGTDSLTYWAADEEGNFTPATLVIEVAEEGAF
jgi:hypothetical protein